MSSNNLKGALYLRVSTTVQDEASQEPDLREQAKRDGVEIIKVFRDKVSGLKDETKREGLNDLLKLTKEDIDIVYVWEISRLSRKPKHFDKLILHFQEKNINVCFVKPQLLYLFDLRTGEERISDSIALSIFSKFALHEIEQKNARSKRGKNDAIINKKNSYTYKPPFGYKNIDKKLYINDDIISDYEGYKTEAEVVKSIFEMYASGKTLSSIKDTLNQYGLITRTHTFQKKQTINLNGTTTKDITEIKWNRRSIHNILQNTVYYGQKDIYNTKKELVKGKEVKTRYKVSSISVPAIITEELFLQVQDQMKKNIAVASKAYKNEFLLRGVLKCGECGNYYLGTGSKGKNFYHCADKTHRRHNTYLGCTNASLSIKFDSVIWNSIKAVYESNKIEETKVATLEELKADRTRLEQIISVKESAISYNEKQLDNIAGNLANTSPALAGRLLKNAEKVEQNTDKLRKEVQSLKLKIGLINNQIKAIEENSDSKVKIDNIDNDFQLKSEAVKELITEVITTKVDYSHRVIEVTLTNGYYFILLYNWNKQKYVELPHNLFKFDRETRLFSSKAYDVSGFSLTTVQKSAISAKSIFVEYLSQTTVLQ